MADTLLKPDVSLVRSYTPSDSKSLPPLHLEHFQKNEKNLYYVGSDHGTDLRNPTHDVIKQAIEKHNPQLVIIEGLNTNAGESPVFPDINPDKPFYQQPVFLHKEENVHTAELARSKNIAFIGGEPSSQSVIQAVKAKGYSAKDVMAHDLLRYIPIWRRDNMLADKEHFPAQAAEYLANNMEFDSIPKDKRLTFDEFKIWYDAHKAEVGNKDYLSITKEDTNPSNAPNANYFQKITNIGDEVRDNHLINIAADALKKYDNVMIVYGNIHQYKAEPVFKKMFGNSPTIEALVLKNREGGSVICPEGAEPKSASDLHILSNILKASSIVLMAAAGVAAFTSGIGSIAAIALLSTSALSFAGNFMIESNAAYNPIPTRVTSIRVTKTFHSDGKEPTEPTHARGDGQLWASVAKQIQPAQRMP